MKMSFLTSTALAAVLTLSACGSQEGDGDGPPEAAAENHMVADPRNPFASAEQRMSERMMAAVGTDAGDSWVRKMIEHHQGAIEMSRRVLEQNPTPDVAKMARDAIDMQTREIANLRKLVKDGAPHGASAELYRQAIMNMRQAMEAATVTDAGEAYARKMLAHHEGGVALSDVALQSHLSDAVRAQVMKTRAGQQNGAEMTEAKLRGAPMPPPSPTRASDSAPASPVPAARASQRPARPSPTTSARPQPTASSAPAETADPHAGHNMSTMQNSGGSGQ